MLLPNFILLIIISTGCSCHFYFVLWMFWYYFRFEKSTIGNHCLRPQHGRWSRHRNKLDMSTARRRLKSPRSLSGTSAHPTMITLVIIMVVNRWLTSFSFHVNRQPHSWDKLFQTLTLKLQGEGHWCDQRSKSCSHPSIILSHFLFISHQSDQQFMSEVTGQGHILYPVSNRCASFSFHINRTSHSWDMAKIMFDLEKKHIWI